MSLHYLVKLQMLIAMCYRWVVWEMKLQNLSNINCSLHSPDLNYSMCEILQKKVYKTRIGEHHWSERTDSTATGNGVGQAGSRQSSLWQPFVGGIVAYKPMSMRQYRRWTFDNEHDKLPLLHCLCFRVSDYLLQMLTA